MLNLEFINACETVSDINEHLPLLYSLSQECTSVVEMGVRTGMSTRAFMLAPVKLRSYDIELNHDVMKLFNHAKQLGKDVEYIKADTLNLEIEECDMLFIDTLHTYHQLSQELKIHGNKAKKYLVFHDTWFFGARGEHGDVGLLAAIIQFMIDNPQWKFKIHRINNNGLTVLERKNA